MTAQYDIIIVGGGLNGCTLALALAGAGFKISVIDKLDSETMSRDFDGRSYAMARASCNLLDAIGLWDSLSSDAQPILEIKVSDGRAGEGPSAFWMHFDHAELEDGPMGHMIEDRFLRPTLLSALGEAPNIDHFAPETVVEQSLRDHGVLVTLASGATQSARLLIGCDGRKSGTADRGRITRSFKDYGQTALVAAIGHQKPHNGIAHQFFMPAGPLAILPLRGNRSSIVWAESHARAAELNAMDDAAFLGALAPAFGDFLGPISLAGTRFSYPLNQTIAADLVGPRLALVGDAAHGIHPIAGQGLNQGLRDAASLAEVLADAARRGEDIAAADVLGRYATWRRADSKLAALATDKFNRLFSNDNQALRFGRDLGMGLVSALPPLRRAFMREAAGLTGDLPRLLRGQSL